MGGAMSRRKGHSFERLIAKRLRGRYPDAARGLQSRDGNDAPDVINTPFWMECKRHKRVNIPAAMEQAIEDSMSTLPPVVVSKNDRGRILVTMEFKTFEGLIGSGNE